MENQTVLGLATEALRATAGVFVPEAFGAKGNGVADDSAAIQKAIDAAYAQGGGMVQLAARTYLINSSLVLKPNVLIWGMGAATVIKVGVSGIRAITSHAFGQSGFGGVQRLCVWGYGDRLTTQGTDADRLVVAGPFDYGVFEQVEAIYSRYVSLTGLGGSFWVDRCVVKMGLRDGIQLNGVTDARVIDNVVDSVADDGIAVHVGANVAGVFDKQIIIARNKLTKCTGIKCLGARNLVISQNILRFCYAYGAYVALDTNSGEGYATKFSIDISHNEFTDMLGLGVIGAGSGNATIYISGARSLGSGATTAPVYPGEFNTATGTFLKPDAYINQGGAAIPRGADSGIRIAFNILRQTLSGFSHFADAGFGNLWWTAGSINPAFATNISLLGGALLHGIEFDTGAYRNVEISGNHVEGYVEALFLNAVDFMRSSSFRSNTVFRCINGVTVNFSTLKTIQLKIQFNDFNLDPYHEATGANGRTIISGSPSYPDGTWAAVGGSNYIAVTTVFTVGMDVRSNDFRNCMQALHTGGGSIEVFRDNCCYWDWSTPATPRGIGQISYSDLQEHFFLHGNPSDASYNSFNTTKDSAFIKEAGAAPTSGYFVAGQFVQNTGLAPNTDGTLTLGWKCLATGGPSAVTWQTINAPNPAVANAPISDPYYSREYVVMNFRRKVFQTGPGPLITDPTTLAGWTYSRTGQCTSQDSLGNVSTFAANVAPITDNGLLIEKAATNYLSNPSVPATQTVTLAAGTYTLSCLGSGSVALSGGPSGTALQGAPATFTLVASTAVTFTCSGTLSWIQAEPGAYPTSFIPGTTAPLTRGAPTARVNGISLPSAYTLYAEVNLEAPYTPGGGTFILASLSDGTFNNVAYLARNDSGSAFIAVAKSGGALVVNNNFGTPTSGLIRAAFRVQAGNFRACFNGTLGSLATSGAAPVNPTSLGLGSPSWGGGNTADGSVQQILVLPPLSDGQLQTLTT